MTTHTHKLIIDGHAMTTGSISDQSALYERIKPAFEALSEALKKEGGTLLCTPQRIGTKKIIPAAPASQSSEVPAEGANRPPGVGEAMQNAPIAGEPTPFPASRRGHGGEPKSAA